MYTLGKKGDKMSDICIVLARLNDKGFSVILENTNIDRELTIVISEDFSIVRFAALASSQSFRLVGIIEFLVGMKNLFRWLYGEIDTISESGLIFPRN
jgi:hypothetical protein